MKRTEKQRPDPTFEDFQRGRAYYAATTKESIPAGRWDTHRPTQNSFHSAAYLAFGRSEEGPGAMFKRTTDHSVGGHEEYYRLAWSYTETSDTPTIIEFVSLPPEALPSAETSDDCGSPGAWDALKDHARNGGIGSSGPRCKCLLSADRDGWREGRWVLA